MPRVFSIPTVCRRVPALLLREFLTALGHPDLGRSPDPDPGNGAVAAAVGGLPAPAYDAVEAAFHTVFDLACETGAAALTEAAESLDEPAVDAPADLTVYERAMAAVARRPDVAERAALIHRVETLNWWRRRDDLPRKAPDAAPETLRRLAAELSAVLVAAQGRGRVCTVEALSRRGTDYFFAHPDDFIQSVTAHDDGGRLLPRTVRRTFPVVLAFEPAAGSLELFAKLPPRLKLEVERAFARTVLAADLGEWTPDATYELNRLKGLPLPLPTDPEAVFAAAGGRPALSEAVAGRVWRLGTAAWAGRSREAFFARNCRGPARTAAVSAIARRPAAVLLVPTEAAAAGWIEGVPNPVVALESVAGFDPDGGLVVDRVAVADRVAAADPGAAGKRRRPRKRGERAANIERLTAAMAEHLRAAREHARITESNTGTPALLPRPTQKALAERTGLDESTVSRCFNDPAARELRLCWEVTADVYRVLDRKQRRPG